MTLPIEISLILASVWLLAFWAGFGIGRWRKYQSEATSPKNEAREQLYTDIYEYLREKSIG